MKTNKLTIGDQATILLDEPIRGRVIGYYRYQGDNGGDLYIVHGDDGAEYECESSALTTMINQ